MTFYDFYIRSKLPVQPPLKVVKPIYAVMVTETFELRPTGAPAFKFGKAPAPARAGNYDDWNELESQDFLIQKHGPEIKLKSSQKSKGCQRYPDVSEA